jgi:CBS domain-containing protein
VGPPTIGALVVTGVPTGFTGMITERDVVRAINTVRHRLEEIQLETNVLRDLYHTRH